MNGTDPFLASSSLAIAGLATAGFIAWRISMPVEAMEEPLR